MLTERTRPAGCLSDLALDRCLANELAAADASAALEHLQSCDRCSERKATFAIEYASVAQRISFRAPAAVQREPQPTKRPSRLAGGGLLALSAFAAAALCLLLIRPEPESTTRTKGGPSISFFVKRGETVAPGEDGMHVAPGDTLRFATSADKPYYFAVLSLDAKGVVSVYAPQGDAMQEILPGAQRPLDSAVLLDQVLGKEEVLGVFCERQHALDMLRDQLRARREAFPPPDCTVDRLALYKEAPP